MVVINNYVGLEISKLFWVRKPQIPEPQPTPTQYCNSCRQYNDNRCKCGHSRCASCCSTCRSRIKPQTTPTPAPQAKIKTWPIGNALDVYKVLVDGSLTLHIRIEQLERSVQSVRNTVAAKGIEAEKRVIRDLKTLLESGLEADLEIKVEGVGEVKLIKAHRCILAARSVVLQRMFASEMKEKITGKLVVDDIGSDAVQIILKYIYCGSVDLDIETDSKEKLIMELIYAADKVMGLWFSKMVIPAVMLDELMLILFQFALQWELTELKELVGSQIITCCDKKNALQLFDLAQKHRISAAVDDIEKFIEK